MLRRLGLRNYALPAGEETMKHRDVVKGLLKLPLFIFSQSSFSLHLNVSVWESICLPFDKSHYCFVTQTLLIMASSYLSILCLVFVFSRCSVLCLFVNVNACFEASLALFQAAHALAVAEAGFV